MGNIKLVPDFTSDLEGKTFYQPPRTLMMPTYDTTHTLISLIKNNPMDSVHLNSWREFRPWTWYFQLPGGVLTGFSHKISEKGITLESFESVCLALANNTSVVKADFTNCKLGPQHAKVLARCLRINTSLEVVLLDGNEILDSGVKEINDAIAANPKSKVAPLEYNITKIGKTAELAKETKVKHTPEKSTRAARWVAELINNLPPAPTLPPQLHLSERAKGIYRGLTRESSVVPRDPVPARPENQVPLLAGRKMAP